MINKMLQDMINNMCNLHKTIGIIDNTSVVVACSDSNEIGKIRDVSFVSISSNNFLVKNGFTYKYFGDKTSDEFAFFCLGEDEEALSCVNMLSVPFTQVVRDYTTKHSKSLFMKNLLFDNLLPGESVFKIRELKIKDNVSRVCLLLHSISKVPEKNLVNLLRGLFPDETKDIIVELNETDIVVIKEITEKRDESQLGKLASSIVNVMSSEYYIQCVVGVGSIAKNVSDLINSFRCAQVAIEVRNVFDSEQSIALYNQLGIARLIYQLPVTLCKIFLEEVFKKCTIDSIDNDLMFTVNKFFENSLNISETARKLFVHRNTLVYRIEKIKKLTGLDLRNFEDAIVFKVSLMVNKYLKGSSIKND